MSRLTLRPEPSFPTYGSGRFLAVAENLSTALEEVGPGDQQAANDQRTDRDPEIEGPLGRGIERRIVHATGVDDEGHRANRTFDRPADNGGLGVVTALVFGHRRQAGTRPGLALVHGNVTLGRGRSTVRRDTTRL